MPDAVEFTVAGNPVPKQRPVTRFKDGQPTRTFTPRRTSDWEEQVAYDARQAMGTRFPFHGDVAIELRFYRATRHACDFDNLAKAVLDAIQASTASPHGIILTDDRQVVEAHIYKEVDPERPRVEVRVWKAGDEPCTVNIAKRPSHQAGPGR